MLNQFCWLVSGAKQMFKLNRYAKDLNDKMAEVKLSEQTLEKWANTLLLQSQKNMFSLQGQMYLRLGKRLESLENRFDGRFDDLSSKIDRGNTLEMVPSMVFNSCKLVLNEEWNRKSVQDYYIEFDATTFAC